MRIISYFLILTILSFGKIGYWKNNKKILQEVDFTNERVIKTNITLFPKNNMSITKQAALEKHTVLLFDSEAANSNKRCVAIIDV